MPGWKKKCEADPTLNYTKRGFRLGDGSLHLTGGIVLTMVWSRELSAVPSSVRVYRDSVGHWYASFVVPAEVQPLPATGAVIGIDWGVKETATTTSDSHDLPHAQHGQKAQQEMSRYDRMMARPQPAKGQAASKGYSEARKLCAKAHQKVARQRQDAGRKWAKKVVTDHDAIAVEDFRPKFLAKTSMARKAADAAIGATKKALLEMDRKHGRDVRLVHPAHTTMDCALCGARTKHALPLSERTYTCIACGAVSSLVDHCSLLSLRAHGRGIRGPLGAIAGEPVNSPSCQREPARAPAPTSALTGPPNAASAAAYRSAGRTPLRAVTRWPSGRTSSTLCADAPG